MGWDLLCLLIRDVLFRSLTTQDLQTPLLEGMSTGGGGSTRAIRAHPLTLWLLEGTTKSGISSKNSLSKASEPAFHPSQSTECFCFAVVDLESPAKLSLRGGFEVYVTLSH